MHMRSFGAAVGGAAVIACLVAATEGFVPTSNVLLRGSFFQQTQGRTQFALCRRRCAERNLRMVYTPAQSSAGLSLEELKERLDRQIAIPSPPSRESPKVRVQRSPCTSLYGNWRPTTGTEPWRSATLHTKPAPAKSKPSAKELEARKEKRATRGRPPVDPKPAVKPEMFPDFVQRAAAVLYTNYGRMDSNLFGQNWKSLHPDAPLYLYKSNKGVTIHQMLRESNNFFTVSETERQKVKMFELNHLAVEKFLRECKANTNEPAVAAVEDEDEEDGIEQIISAVTAETSTPPPAPQMVVKEEQIEQASMMPVVAAPRAAAVMDSRYSEVPVHGKARMSSHDRRLRVRPVAAVKSMPVEVEDDLPAAPLQTPQDALRHPAVALYNSWAIDGRDIVMEVAHAAAFDEMYARIVADREAKGVEFSAIDAGCGNGWATRKLAAHPLCRQATGVDGAALMIKKAMSTDSEALARYEVGDAQSWKPDAAADVVMAQELLYLVEDPQRTVGHLVRECLAPGGRFIAALDCFKENKASQSWAEDLGVPMHCLSEAAWRKVLKEAGLGQVEAWRSKASGPWQGTLIVTGVRAA